MFSYIYFYQFYFLHAFQISTHLVSIFFKFCYFFICQIFDGDLSAFISFLKKYFYISSFSLIVNSDVFPLTNYLYFYLYFKMELAYPEIKLLYGIYLSILQAETCHFVYICDCLLLIIPIKMCIFSCYCDAIKWFL